MTDPENLELIIKQRSNNVIADLIEKEDGILSHPDHVNIYNIYKNCSVGVKEAFDGDSTNNIDSWTFADWIKIVLPIVKAIEKYNSVEKKGEYKKVIAILITKVVIVNELTISEENRALLLDAIDDYLKPSIDIIVYMINNTETGGNFLKKCCPCF